MCQSTTTCDAQAIVSISPHNCDAVQVHLGLQLMHCTFACESFHSRTLVTYYCHMQHAEALWYCRWLDADGSKQVGSAFEKPEEVLRLPQGVTSVSAGLHSSAAISMDGQLWMWGKVISKVRAYTCCFLLHYYSLPKVCRKCVMHVCSSDPAVCVQHQKPTSRRLVFIVVCCYRSKHSTGVLLLISCLLLCSN